MINIGQHDRRLTDAEMICVKNFILPTILEFFLKNNIHFAQILYNPSDGELPRFFKGSTIVFFGDDLFKTTPRTINFMLKLKKFLYENFSAEGLLFDVFQDENVYGIIVEITKIDDKKEYDRIISELKEYEKYQKECYKALRKCNYGSGLKE
jgi:hypothetical protein